MRKYRDSTPYFSCVADHIIPTFQLASCQVCSATSDQRPACIQGSALQTTWLSVAERNVASYLDGCYALVPKVLQQWEMLLLEVAHASDVPSAKDNSI